MSELQNQELRNFRAWVSWRTAQHNCWYGWHIIDQMTRDRLLEIIGDADRFDDMKRRCGDWVLRNMKNPARQPVKRVAKMSTKEYRSRLRDLKDVKGAPGETPCCWEAALDAFGCDYRTGKAEYPHKYQPKLADEGWDITRMKLSDLVPDGVAPTLAVVMAELARRGGDYMVFTPGHVTAIRDGVITDTVGEYGTVVRRVNFVWEITRKPAEVILGKITYPDPRCDCQQPGVFGHDPRCPTWRKS